MKAQGERMAELCVPILVDWNDIKDHLAKSDIVEVVRCKDCKYSVFEQWVDALDIYTCNRTSLTRACGDCSPTDFCSWGERKSEVETCQQETK